MFLDARSNLVGGLEVTAAGKGLAHPAIGTRACAVSAPAAEVHDGLNVRLRGCDNVPKVVVVLQELPRSEVASQLAPGEKGLGDAAALIFWHGFKYIDRHLNRKLRAGGWVPASVSRQSHQ